MDRQQPSRSGTELMLDLARLLKAAVRIARAAAVAGLPGAAAAAVGVGLMNTNKRQLKKTANKAMKTMGSLVNDVSSMMR